MVEVCVSDHPDASVVDLPAFSGVFVFGDSLVDPGNALKAANFLGSLPFTSTPERAPTADKGYFEGRFTDGYNFADLVSNKLLLQPTKTTFPYGFEDPLLGIPITLGGRPDGNNLSFAYGGAQAIRGEELVPDLDEQTDAYRTFPSADPNALYIITIGGTDLRELVPPDGAPVVGAAADARLLAIAVEIADEVAQLYGFGARKVLVTGMPDVGLLPDYLGAADEATKRSLATQYAVRLDALVRDELGKIALPDGARLFGYDALAFSRAVLADPGAFGLTNLTQARTVVQAGALDPVGAGFLFFDEIHPSAQTHALVAAGILEGLGGGVEGPVAQQAGPKVFAAVESAAASDDFQTALVAGQTYVFDMLGVSSGSGALADPRLQILDAGGSVVGGDDDAGLGLDAHLEFTAPSTGVYILRAAGVGVTQGSYIVQGPDLRGSDVRVQGGTLNDTIGALFGGNTLRGGEGADSLVGGTGFDNINGNPGADTAAGGSGDDWVLGGKDNDVVKGNLGADTCSGGAGDDVVRGGRGDDLLRGDAGDDFLSGDRGADTLSGGTGADRFHAFGEAGLDRVLDFNPAEGDRVQLDPGTQYAVSQSGPDTVVSLTGGAQITLAGVSMGSLADGWIFEA